MYKYKLSSLFELVRSNYIQNSGWGIKGPVKLIQWVKIPHSLLQHVSNLFNYHFKLAYVILHMAVKEFFEKPTSEHGEIDRFNLGSHF